MEDEKNLGEGVNIVIKLGDTVRRIPGKWTPSVHALLKHLREHGFFSAPEVLGFDEKGREILSYINGEVSNYPLSDTARSTTALISAAKLLRRYHDATVKFASSYHGTWQFDAHHPVEVICHGDYAQYNCVIRGDKVVGIIDFDTSHPGSRIWDLAYAVYRWAPLTSPDNKDGFGTCTEQAERMKLFCNEYGLTDSKTLIPIVIERLQTLVHFINTQAQDGNVTYQKYLAEGHGLLYLKDISYLKDNAEFFLKYL